MYPPPPSWGPFIHFFWGGGILVKKLSDPLVFLQ